MFTDKRHFTGFQYVGLGEDIEGTLCGYNGEPEQFTGLKDKNGKEIYEGDILGYWGTTTWEVLWVEKKCAFRFGNYVLNFPMTECIKKEVIGNIYENPELLKK